MNNEKKLKPIAYGIYFGIAVCFVILRMLSAFGVFNGLNSWFNIIFTILGQVVILFGGAVLLFSFISKNKVKDTLNFYGYKKISGRTILICFFMGIIVFFLNVFVSSFFSNILAWLGYKSNPGSTITEYPIWLLLLNLVLTAVLPAICEETVHRGMIFNTKMGKNYKWSILITSLLFGLLHMNIDQFFYAFIIGLFLGYITMNTRSIYPAMIIHFSNNALSVLLGYSSVRGTGFSAIFNNLSSILSINPIFGVILLITLVIALLYLLFRSTHLMFIVNATSQIILNKDALDKFIKRESFLAEVRDIQSGDSNSPFKNRSFIIPSDSLVKDIFNIKEVEYQNDVLSKIFLWLSIILMSAITIFTFIWGIL